VEGEQRGARLDAELGCEFRQQDFGELHLKCTIPKPGTGFRTGSRTSEMLGDASDRGAACMQGELLT
jgi:hypothetical protein